jgi:hypothetical protein
MMARIRDFFLCLNRITGILLLVLSVCPPSRLAAQQSETAESLGLGGASRFETGFAPIAIERTRIIPGVPFNVKPTMDNLVSSSKTSMGGILNRFDTSKFGQMFGTGTTTATQATLGALQRRSSPAAAVSATTPGKPTTYPPRLEFDVGDTAATAESVDDATRERIYRHVSDFLARYSPKTPKRDVNLLYDGRTLILRGRVDSAYTADILALTMEMEPGIDKVVNELTAPE